MKRVMVTGGVHGGAARTVSVLAVGGALLLATACGGAAEKGQPAAASAPAPAAASDGASAGASASASAGASASAETAETLPKSSAATVKVTPANGAEEVQPSGVLKIEATGGKLSEVVVTDKNGKKVAGTTAADGLSWKPAAGLAGGTVYTVNAQATDPEGLVSAVNSSFTTAVPKGKVVVSDNIGAGQTYGVGMIVSVRFGKQVKNKDAVVQAVSVTGSDGTVAKGHWLQDDRRLDFRPEHYWKPGTKVTVKYRLQNVEITPGYYGDKDVEDAFTVGESRISTVDAKTHRMTVTTAAGSRTVPISAGDDLNPSWNGTMVIFTKDRLTRMNSATVPGVKGEPYDLDNVPHAMKLTDTGTYVHGNHWNENIGKGNYSHGCIGLFDKAGGSSASDAGKFFAESRIGDVVQIVNSKGKTVQAQNGLSGWTLPWDKW
ncbi:Ig-like domain-containing protein [Kitasatospora sp. NPDC096147]|uniref:L,D-transpeptidase n=1 Tax=Kitasatospora sp. NPDC096147 TaxID=3364093 RepID=UPI003825746E